MNVDADTQSKIVRQAAENAKLQAKAADIESQIQRIRGASGHHMHGDHHHNYAQVGSFNPDTDEFIELTQVEESDENELSEVGIRSDEEELAEVEGADENFAQTETETTMDPAGVQISPSVHVQVTRKGYE